MFQTFDIIYYLILSLIFVMGIFVLFNNSKSKNNWSFFIFVLGAMGWIISLRMGWLDADYANWKAALFWMRFSYGFSIVGMSLMVTFIYLFPRPTISIPRILQIIYLGLNFAIFLLAGLTPLINKSLIIENGIYIKDALGSLYPLYVFVILLNLLLSAYLLINKLKNTYGIEREKISLVFFGYLAFAALAVLTNVVLPIFNILILQQESQILIIAFIIPAYYAIHRYRFFNFSYYSFNLLRKLIFCSTFLFIFFSSFILLAFFVPEKNIWFYNIPALLITIVVFESIRQFIPIFTPGNLREFQNAISELQTKIYFCDTYAKLQSAIEKIFLINLNFVSAKIYIIRKKKAEIGIPIYLQNKFTDGLREYKKDVLIRDEIEFKKLKIGEKKYLISVMDKLEADLCVPLFSETHLIGFFVIEKKEGKNLYSKEEIKELLQFKNHLEICLMNILLKLNLEEENNLMQAIIDKKTKDLKEKVQQVKELLQQQSDFIAVTAHEFRTPLSIALFQIEEILRQKDKKRTQAQLNEDLKVIDTSLDNLKTLTQKLFAIQQYDLNKVKLQKEKTDIKKYIDEIYRDFSILMKEKKLDFSLDNKLKDKTYYEIDKSQMRQVMQNILTNAYKFTPENGRIMLSARKHGKNILIKISDNGKGIPKGMKKAIFEKFRTSGSSGTGIGLGLYVCKKIIDLHKGKIWAESSELGGAVFCVELRK
jgi:signal transduction histidine kinase